MGHLKEQIYGEKKGKDIKENSYKEKNIKEIIEKLPDIPYRKALSITNVRLIYRKILTKVDFYVIIFL